MSVTESERRVLYESFAKNFWPPEYVARWPIPQLVKVWLWREQERSEISHEEAVEFMKRRESGGKTYGDLS